MVQYILEAIAFQLVFLIIYDFFLKKETFFQWNRLYLLGTYSLSLILPWVKLEMIRAALPDNFYRYPEYLWGLSEQRVVTVSTGETGTWLWAPEYLILGGGMLLSFIFFGFKLYKIRKLLQKGTVQHFPEFTRVIIENSSLAFSFFRSIFLGDKIREKDHRNIIEHELVHIQQRHTLDLMFFEAMRILGWFNPLVYIFQERISELHEYIADAKVSKSHKKEQYQFLLSQVFQTESISFVNQYFKPSLTKKRILMLQKARSKGIWKLKYLFLIPIITAMLIYSSCQKDAETQNDQFISVDNIENLGAAEEDAIITALLSLSEGQDSWKLTVRDKNSTVVLFTKAYEGSYISGPDNIKIKAEMHIDSKILDESFVLFDRNAPNSVTIDLKDNGVPFGLVEKTPVYPGCENAVDQRACFNDKMYEHIRKNFNYPIEAREAGIEGKVNVMFTIDEHGEITNIRKRGPHALLEAEVVRIISRLPKMKPGEANGKAVKVPYSLPITFKL